jgi:lipopolysaccharide export LptBFGC system permease protein LptF
MTEISAKPARKAHPIYLAPLGLYSRYMLAAYFRQVLTVAAALMTIALTIDLWPQVPLLTGGPGHSVPATIWTIVRLAALRIPDLLPPFIPFATFLGVVSSEGAFTGSRERMLIWNSGRSPLQCLIPALMIGVLMGAALFLIDGYLRPAAIAVQIHEKLGREGIRLDRSQSGGNHWLELPNGLLRAEIVYGPSLELRNVTVYRLDAVGHLSEVDTASLATPPLSGGQWLLHDGHYWSVNLEAQGAEAAGAQYVIGDAREEPETSFRERKVSLGLNTLWLANQGMSPQYLSLSDLRLLAHARINPHEDGSFRTRLRALYGEIALTCGMAVLAASLSLFYFAYRLRPIALIVTLLAGYLAHFAARALLLMGEFGYVWPSVAGWLMPMMLFLTVGGIFWVIQKRRGLKIVNV